LEDAVLYGHARNLDVTPVARPTCVAVRRSAEIVRLIIHGPRKSKTFDSAWRQARQARDEWRRERYSRLMAR
jgi:hypothetical protein